MNFHTLFRVGVALLLLVSLVGAPVAAQNATPGNETETNTTATGNASTPDVANQTGPTAGRASGGGGGGSIFPGPWEMTKKIANKSYEDMAGGVGNLVDGFNHIVLALPAPGERDDPVSWVSPPADDSWWSSVWMIYWGLSALVFVPLGASGVWAMSRRDGRGRREHARQVAKAFILILAGWVILPFALHTGNAVSLGLAPSGAEFFSTPGNTARLGVGVILGLALAVTKVVVILAGLLVIVVQWFLIHFLFAAWPALVAGRASGNTYLETIGHAGVAAFVFLIILKCAQALILRFLFEIPIGADAEGLFSFGVILVGLAIVLIALPVWGAAKVIPRSVTSIGGSVTPDVAKTIDERAPDHTTITNRVRNVRGGSGEGSGRSSAGQTPTSSSRVTRSDGGTSSISRRSAQARSRTRQRSRDRASSGRRSNSDSSSDSDTE